MPLFAQQDLTFCDKIDEVAKHNAAVGAKLAHVRGIQSDGATSDDEFAVEMARRVANRAAAGRAVHVAIGDAITAVLTIVQQAKALEVATMPEDGVVYYSDAAVRGAREDIVGARATATRALSRVAAADSRLSEGDSAAAAATATVIDATRCAANAARVIAEAAAAWSKGLRRPAGVCVARRAVAADGADVADAVAGRLEDAALQLSRAWGRVVDYPTQVDWRCTSTLLHPLRRWSNLHMKWSRPTLRC